MIMMEIVSEEKNVEGKNQKYSKILPSQSFALSEDKRLKPLIKLTMATYFSGQKTSVFDE
jgi:hypothetical protein